MFIGGLILFNLASLACGLSQNPGELIAARIVQGFGAGIYYSSKITPSLLHTSQAAIVVNLGLVFAALLCRFGLPSSLSSDRAEENA